MSVQTRYFRITTGPLIDAVKQHDKINNAAIDEYRKIIKEIGANGKIYHIDFRVSGFSFDGEVNKDLYKRTKGGGWYPKLNTAFGKELNRKITEVKTSQPDSLLKAIGISSRYALIDERRLYSSNIIYIPINEIVAFAAIPWKEIDPAELETYEIDNAAGKHMNMNLDHLLWKPDEHLIEIKEWQFKKEIEEYNESIRNKAAA